jgi:hypothetical protein
MKPHACLCILLLTVASVGHAQGGPPYLTDDPGTPGPRRWEINLASTLDRRPNEYLVQIPDIDIAELTRRYNLLASVGHSLRGSRCEPDLLAYLGVQLHLQPSKRRVIKAPPETH